MTPAAKKNLRARLDRQVIQKPEVTKMKARYGAIDQERIEAFASGLVTSIVLSNGLILSRG